VANDQRQAELNLKIANQSGVVNSAAQKELAIVSPCSTCQNYKQTSSDSPDPYRTSCPRRSWIAQNKLFPPDNDPAVIDKVLYFSGTSDPNTLANPAVDTTTGNYLVWVASVEDNSGVVDSDGNVITKGILDPSFNNLYIRCRPQPYVPEDHHDILRNLGAFQENDHVIAEAHRIPPMTAPATNFQVPYNSTPIAGTVTKSTFAYSFNTTNPDDHALVSGT
jgi:hypothetical protein